MASTAIAVAAGGGGDLVTASVLAAKLRHQFDVVALMSYSWDRLVVDPTPGPRTHSDFDGLIRHHDMVAEVTASARLRGPGQSTLPQLVNYLAHPLLLMDPADGSIGLSAQFRAACQLFGADALIIIDIGGDVLAEGHETGLRSPLADSLTLAAAEQSNLPLHLLIAGVGLDGELAPPQLRTLLDRYQSTAITELNTEDVSVVAEVWTWHPSEANGLLCAAARGWRGVAETQRDALISITDDATTVYEVDASSVAAHSLAADLSGSPSLELAEQTIRDRRGYSDIDIERQRQATHRKPRMPTPATLDEIDRYAHAASLRGVDALTVRRVIELCGASGAEAGAALRGLLSRRRPDKLRPPLYLV